MPKLDFTENLYTYLLNIGINEAKILKEIREFNLTLPNNRMQIAPEQGQFMAFLAKMINAKKYLEIGVFTGYSSTVMALAMPKDSIIYALDNDSQHLEIASKFWDKANIKEQIQIYHNDAIISLEDIYAKGLKNYFDIAFIDANKNNYIKYYEYCLKLVRANGIIILDNVLMNGQVVHKNPPTYVKEIIKLNELIQNDHRVFSCMLPIADGITIALKKESYEVS